jgi:hypothetical protein
VSWERVAWVAAYRSGAPSRCIRGSASPPRLPTTLTSNRIGRREKASGKPSHLFLLPVRLGRRCKARHSLSELADAHEAAFEDTTILDALNEDSRYLYLIATRPTANILSPTSSDTTEHYRVGGSCTHPYPARMQQARWFAEANNTMPGTFLSLTHHGSDRRPFADLGGDDAAGCWQLLQTSFVKPQRRGRTTRQMDSQEPRASSSGNA